MDIQIILAIVVKLPTIRPQIDMHPLFTVTVSRLVNKGTPRKEADSA